MQPLNPRIKLAGAILDDAGARSGIFMLLEADNIEMARAYLERESLPDKRTLSECGHQYARIGGGSSLGIFALTACQPPQPMIFAKGASR